MMSTGSFLFRWAIKNSKAGARICVLCLFLVCSYIGRLYRCFALGILPSLLMFVSHIFCYISSIKAGSTQQICAGDWC